MERWRNEDRDERNKDRDGKMMTEMTKDKRDGKIIIEMT